MLIAKQGSAAADAKFLERPAPPQRGAGFITATGTGTKMSMPEIY